MLSFHFKYVQTDRDRHTYGRTDRRTTVKQYAPDLSMWGHDKKNPKTINISYAQDWCISYSEVLLEY